MSSSEPRFEREHETEALIRQLAAGAGAVRVLAAPWRRAAMWGALSIPIAGAMLAAVAHRDRLFLPDSDPRFLLEEAASLATAAAAAVAALASIVPGYRRAWMLAPLLPFGVWLAAIGAGCLHAGATSTGIGRDWSCVSAIAATGAAPAALMAAMLRRGAPLAPFWSAALGGLASAALGNSVMRLAHPPDASVLVLVWHVGAVCLLTATLGGVGRRLLRWPAVHPARPPAG